MKINILEIPVFYINLKKDVEKNKSTLQTLKRAGFKNINRFDAILGDAKKDGCAKSHQAFLKEIDIDGPFIVFEDDIELNGYFDPIIELPDDTDALYLGLSRFSLINGRTDRNLIAERVDEDIYRIYNMLAAHAILYVNKEYYKFLGKAIQAMLDVNRNQDNARAETMKYFNVYALNTPLFYQGGKHEPVTKFVLSKTRTQPYSLNKPVNQTVYKKKIPKAGITMLTREFLDSSPRVDIVILNWQRRQNIKKILESLSKQTYKKFNVHISNGDIPKHDRLVQTASYFVNEFNMNIMVRPDGNDLFAFRRLIVAKELAEAGSDIIMFIDDDIDIPSDYVEMCLSQYEPKTYGSGFAWSIYNKGADYYKDRTRQDSNDYKIHYCGTGVSVIDAKIFLNKELTDLKKMPRGALKIEDLWLSFIAQHRLGYKLKYIDMPGVVINGGDRVALYKAVAKEDYDKADFLRDLVKMGWKIPLKLVKA